MPVVSKEVLQGTEIPKGGGKGNHTFLNTVTTKTFVS